MNKKNKVEISKPGNRDIFPADIKNSLLKTGFYEKEAEKLAKIIFLYYHSGVRAMDKSITDETRRKTQKIMDDLADRLRKEKIPPFLWVKSFFDIIELCIFGLPDLHEYNYNMEIG